MTFSVATALGSASPRNAIRVIVASLGLVVLGLWGAVALSIVASRHDALTDAQEESRNLMIAFREEMNFILRGIDHSMGALAARIRQAGGDFDLYAWGRDNVLVVPGMAQATLVGPDGKLRSTTLTAHPSPTDLSDRAHFRVHLDGTVTGLYIGRSVVGRDSGKVLLPISRRIDGDDGGVLGVLVVLVNPAELTTLHRSIDLGRNGAMTLTGLDEIIRARFSSASPEGIDGIGTSVAGGPRPAVIPENGLGTFVRRSVLDGVNRIYAYGRVGNFPLVVTVGLDLDQQLAIARSNARTLLAVAAVATALLTGLAVYLIREIRARANRERDLAEGHRQLEAANIALSDSMERAEAASRAKSLFLANMSHELRTPLNAVIGYSQIIRDHAFGAEALARYREYAGNIAASGEHLLRLITDILDTAKLEAGKLDLADEVVGVSEIVAPSIAQLRLAAEHKEIAIETTLSPLVSAIRCDPRRLSQVLLNLLSNAIKFTPPGGTVSLTVAPDEAGAGVITIRDSGIGLSAEEIAIALEPFSQVDESYAKTHEGTGLGLPLSQRLVELHGGTMEITSAKGSGTTVRVRLPADRMIMAPSLPSDGGGRASGDGAERPRREPDDAVPDPSDPDHGRRQLSPARLAD